MTPSASAMLRKAAALLNTAEHGRLSSDMLHVAHELDRRSRYLRDAAAKAESFFFQDDNEKCKTLGTLTNAAKMAAETASGEQLEGVA